MARSAVGEIRFGIVTDIHYEPGTGSLTEAGLGQCFAGWQSSGASFALQLGDLISREGSEAETDLLTVRELFSKCPVPVWHVAGNHCLAVPPERFRNIMGLESLYYSFRSDGFRFIVLDGMDVSILSPPGNETDRRLFEYHYVEQQDLFYCGAVGSEQLAWLDEELYAASATAEPVILLCHFPLLPETTDVKHGLLWNHESVTAVISRYPNVKACIGGHYHHGASALRNGIRFIVLPSFTNRETLPCPACFTAHLSASGMLIRTADDCLLHTFRFD